MHCWKQNFDSSFSIWQKFLVTMKQCKSAQNVKYSIFECYRNTMPNLVNFCPKMNLFSKSRIYSLPFRQTVIFVSKVGNRFSRKPPIFRQFSQKNHPKNDVQTSKNWISHNLRLFPLLYFIPNAPTMHPQMHQGKGNTDHHNSRLSPFKN